MIIVATLLGGIGLFLLGMSMMTEGLKLAGGDALRSILQRWTRSHWRGLLAGILITAIVQSSTAVTVATVGFVNAGLMTLAQSIWVIFGTNVGTTMTGWLVALVGVKVDVGQLALPLVGIGMLTHLVARSNPRRSGLGQALTGFGAFFLGVGFLQQGFADLGPTLAALRPEETGLLATLGFVLLGIVLTNVTQSSSAAVAIILTASAGAEVPFVLAAAAVVGSNIGTTTTAFLAAIGATPPAKRVAAAHIGFNLLTGAVAIALLPVLARLSTQLAELFAEGPDIPTRLAVFHTLFNCLGVAIIWPLAPWFIRTLSRLFVTPADEIATPRHLDQTLIAMPSLALRALTLELRRMADAAYELGLRRILGGPGDAFHLAEQHRGVIELGEAIREFVGRLGRGVLAGEVVDALPDHIRALQHLEELIGFSAEIAGPARQAQPRPQDERRRRLEAAVEACLARAPSEPPGPAEDPLARHALEAESAYQALKTSLLHDTARGALGVQIVDLALQDANRLRRIADSARKAERRLSPWLARLDDASSPSPPQ